VSFDWRYIIVLAAIGAVVFVVVRSPDPQVIAAAGTAIAAVLGYAWRTETQLSTAKKMAFRPPSADSAPTVEVDVPSIPPGRPE